ncbi:nucleoporin p58/p45, partial [Lecanoromycetidae sp. Uapishka_2]
MFGRSQSGPGGLSINTSSANALGSSSTQPPPSGGKPATSLFGSVGTSQPQSTQPQQASSLFGNPTQPQQSGSLFGASTQIGNNQQQQQGSNIFGGVQGNQSTGGGIFGTQQNQQQTGGGLFGSSNAQRSQPQQGGSLFGSLGQDQSQNKAQQPQNSLFGSLNNQNKMSSSLFVAPPSLKTQGQGTNLQPPPPISLFPNQIGQQNQQQTVPGVKISVNELRGTTRINDLHEELQRVILDVDNFIHGQIKIYEDLGGTSTTIDEMSHQMGPDVEYCTKTLDTMQHALENDAESIAIAKELVKTDVADARLSFKVIQNLKQPSQFHQTGPWATSTSSKPLNTSVSGDGAENGMNRSIVDYFSKQSEEMAKSLDTYKRNILEVENYLKGVESNTMQQIQQMMFSQASDGGEKSAEDQVRELAAVLREFDTGINGVAVKVGGAREKVQQIMLGSVDSGGARDRR